MQCIAGFPPIPGVAPHLNVINYPYGGISGPMAALTHLDPKTIGPKGHQPLEIGGRESDETHPDSITSDGLVWILMFFTELFSLLWRVKINQSKNWQFISRQIFFGHVWDVNNQGALVLTHSHGEWLIFMNGGPAKSLNHQSPLSSLRMFL